MQEPLEARVETLEDLAHGQAAITNLLITMLERHQETMDRQDAMLQEMRRDNQQTRRLWVRLCKKYGWLDDEDLAPDAE